MILTVHSNYGELCNEIINLNPHIRSAKIVNDYGHVISGASKDKDTCFANCKDENMLFIEVALRTKMLGDFDPFLGPINFSVYSRKNSIIMEFPIENATVYVTSEKEIDLNEVPFNILALLRIEDLSRLT